MAGLLERQLARALDQRLAVFTAKAADGSLLQDEMSLRAAAYMASELIMPCCCMLCNRDKLKDLLAATSLCSGRPELAAALADLVYQDLARCNGLG